MKAKGCQFLGCHIAAEHVLLCAFLKQVSEKATEVLLCPAGMSAPVQPHGYRVAMASARQESIGTKDSFNLLADTMGLVPDVN